MDIGGWPPVPAVARRYQGAGVYTVINIVTAEGAKIIADDFDDADGHTILSFAQAKVKERRAKIVVDAAGPYTVARVMDEYLANIKRTGRPIRGAAWVTNALVKPKLGNIAAENLTTAKLQDWLHEAASRPLRAITPKGAPQNYHPLPTDRDSTRRR